LDALSWPVGVAVIAQSSVLGTLLDAQGT
jgi:hypothetical protein